MLIYWLFDFVSFPEEFEFWPGKVVVVHIDFFALLCSAPQTPQSPPSLKSPFYLFYSATTITCGSAPSLHYSLKRSSRETAKTTAEATLFASLLSETQSCAFLVRCLKTVVSCTLPSFLAMYSGRAIPITPSWLQAEMSSSVWKI